jgi:hypothetical protein
VVASVAIQKFDTLSDTAAEQALTIGVRELINTAAKYTKYYLFML